MSDNVNFTENRCKPNNGNKRLFVRFVSLFGVFAICFAVFIPFFNVGSTFAVESLNESSYTFFIPNFSFVYDRDLEDETTDFLTISNNPYVTHLANVNGNPTIRFYYPTSTNGQISYSYVPLVYKGGSKYSYNGAIDIACFSQLMSFSDYDTNVTDIGITNIDYYLKYGTFIVITETVLIRGYAYGTYPNTKYVVQYLDNDSTVLLEIYFTISYIDKSHTSRVFYDDFVFADRSSYVSSTERVEYVYINEVDTFNGLYESIKSGISNFLDISLFGNFKVGHIFGIFLSIGVLTLLLHLLVK